MVMLAGIDEAGYGPLLGPLVVSSSCFCLPDGLLEEDLWKVLKRSVSKSKKGQKGRLLIADSKKAYSTSLGTKHLERTVLACLASMDRKVKTTGEILSQLAPASLEHIDSYPWYKDFISQSLAGDSDDISIAGKLFANDLAEKNIKFLGLKSCCLDVAQYNQMVGSVKNKANVLFTAVCGLIKQAADNCSEEKLQILIDRQGGTTHYRNKLQLMFPESELKILKETENNSSYEIIKDGKTVRLHFVVGADDRFLPTALASMASKYLRELFVERINRYFLGFNPVIKPTAGYWQDGLRFIEDIKRHIPELKYDEMSLVRCR